ncbi:MAG: hypothetical protein ABIG28_00075 [archaeon]
MDNLGGYARKKAAEDLDYDTIEQAKEAYLQAITHYQLTFDEPLLDMNGLPVKLEELVTPGENLDLDVQRVVNGSHSHSQ